MIRSNLFTMSPQDDLRLLMNTFEKDDTTLTGCVLECGEMAVTDMHFQDLQGTVRYVFALGDTVVSVRPLTTAGIVTKEEIFQGYNIRVGEGIMLRVEGGHPFRLCGGIQEMMIVSILAGDGPGMPTSIPLQLPDRRLVPDKLTRLTDIDAVAMLFGDDRVDQRTLLAEEYKASGQSTPGKGSSVGLKTAKKMKGRSSGSASESQGRDEDAVDFVPDGTQKSPTHMADASSSDLGAVVDPDAAPVPSSSRETTKTAKNAPGLSISPRRLRKERSKAPKLRGDL